MCLGVPGKIIEIHRVDSLVKTGIVEFAGVKKEINLMYVPEAKVGDFVIVHVGFAISLLDEKAAQLTFQYLEEMLQL